MSRTRIENNKTNIATPCASLRAILDRERRLTRLKVLSFPLGIHTIAYWARGSERQAGGRTCRRTHIGYIFASTFLNMAKIGNGIK